MVIAHVANINLSNESGMGRISSFWRDAFEKTGHTFYHIGKTEVNKNVHANIWGYYARKYLNSLNIKCDVLLVHEPYGGFFISKKFKTIVFSHGVEDRSWHQQQRFGYHLLSFKSKLFPTVLRFYSNNIGFKKAYRVLLSNTTDINYLVNTKNIKREKIQLFKNGYFSFNQSEHKKDKIVFLYNASWIGRKGMLLMYQCFNTLLRKYSHIKLIIAGTVRSKEEVLSGFAADVRANITVISEFSLPEEVALYDEANIFVLPSYFEGQSLALTQAMAMGLCPVAADNCGQKDFIQAHANGLLFETGNAGDFAEQLEFLILNSSKIEEYGRNARDSVKNLTWEKVTSSFVDLCLT